VDAILKVKGGAPPVIAVPDMRGSGGAQPLMDTFNKTLFSDLEGAGFFQMASKAFYPLDVPQRPQDFRPPVNNQKQGSWLTDWSGDPVKANYMTVGYTGVQDGRMVLFGWLFDVTQSTVVSAQLLGKLYFAVLNEEGAQRLAHDFARDIIAVFNVKSVIGTKIYYTSTRSGVKEIWSMDWDGANKKQVTRLGSISSFAAVSPDATRLAFMSYTRGGPSIVMMSLESGRLLPFYNQRASMNSNPEFTNDGKLLFSSTAHITAANSGFANLYMSNVDGSGIRRVTSASAVEVEPKVNPKASGDVVFVSGRSGPAQIYKMNIDGADAVRLTSGEGQAANPSWHPDGQHIAFCWTRGYDPGNFNIFVMDVATREFVQLTSGAGRNENPSWAPDGRHLVFSSNRSGSTQIWTMLANGTQLRQLTHEGRNGNPVWSR
jgi:TolB protein